MPQRIVQVDAFTAEPFSGNPAAVCVLEGPAQEAWMRNVAREMNLSETAFVSPAEREGEEGDWLLRWFTPTAEVDLCGHATLATAHVLFEDGYAPADAPVRFQTKSGPLTARWESGSIVMDFPAEPAQTTDAPEGLLDGVGVDPAAVEWLGRNRMDLLVVLKDPAVLRRLVPDMTRLARISARGIIVTAAGDGGGTGGRAAPDFLSRFFGPAVGVPEDPVTGSAHCCLAPYWAERLARTELLGHQVSARGGEVRVRHLGDRVDLIGQAVTVMRAELI